MKKLNNLLSWYKSLNTQDKSDFGGFVAAASIVLFVFALAIIRPYGIENMSTQTEKEIVIEKAVKQSKVLEQYGEYFTKKWAR